MSVEAVNPFQLNQRSAASLIRENFPEDFGSVSDDEVEYVGEGADNVVYRVRGYIFRFSNNAEISKQNEREARILPALQKGLTLQIPNIERAGLQPNGLTFLGYKEIQGEPFKRDILASLGAEDKEAVVEQMATFLSGVRNFPPENALQEGITNRDLKRFVTRIWETYEGGFMERFDSTEQKKLKSIFGDYLGNAENFNYTSCLVHGDLGPGNVLFDTEKRRMSGVIDWSDMVVTDPAFEMQDLYQSYGEEFIRAVLEKMGADVEKEIRAAVFLTVARNLQRFMRRVQVGDKRWETNLGIVKSELAK